MQQTVQDHLMEQTTMTFMLLESKRKWVKKIHTQLASDGYLSASIVVVGL